MQRETHPYEEPFLILLIALAMGGLLWLFSSFIPAILFAILIATATYPFYQRLTAHSRFSPDTAALITTLAILSLVIFPITYLLIVGSQMGVELFIQWQLWTQAHPQSFAQQVTDLTLLLPIPKAWQATLQAWITNDLAVGLTQAQAVGMKLAGSLFSGTANFVAFIALSLFSLFFFYRDGERFSQRIKNLSPLDNHLDGFIMKRFSDLSTVLTISVLGVAMLQGAVFGILMQFFGMPALFLGIAFALASFIPIVGGSLIWLPVVGYFLLTNQWGLAIFTSVYSIVLIGFTIDNLLRPIIIRKLSVWRGGGRQDKLILSHTWLTMLSTFAGLLHFGVIGLLFGPMLAAMAITVFDVYEHKHRHLLDYS